MSPLAARLLDHAAGVMPPARADWVRGMRAELTHIADPLAAAAFALGCVQASYAQRLTDMMTLARLTRWTLAAFAAGFAGWYLVATVLLASVKASPNLQPRDLGSDPGTAETLRFIQAYPAWQVGAFALVATLLAVGAVLLARRRAAALLLLAAGAAAANLIAVLDLRLVGADAGWPLAWSAAWLIPLVCLSPVWWLSRRAPDLGA
jgi:hypothetical protein